MALYDQNLSLLQRKDPALARRVAEEGEDARVSLQKTKAGMPTLLVHTEQQTYALHHPEDPVGYCNTFLSTITGLDEARNIALLGCGLGYLPLLILQKRPAPRCFFLFEPSLSVFRLALRTVDFTQLINHPSVFWAVGNQPGGVYNAMMPKVMELMANSLLAVEVPSQTAPFPAWAESCKQQMREVLQFGQSGLLTKFRDGPLCLSNLLRNLETLAALPGLKEIGNVFHNLPAIIVAAGPSLAKNIDELKHAQREFLIISTDTAYEPLLNHDIVPHFVATVDPTELNLRHFPTPRYGPDSFLLLDPEARPEIAEKFPHGVTYMTDKHPFFAWLDRQLGGKGILRKGGMVSQAGFYTALFLGCNPIILVGQDLALDPATGATHAPDTALCRKARFLPDDTGHADIPVPDSAETINRESLFWVEGIDGKPVPTLQNLLVYLRMVEEDVRNAPARVIDATEGGAKIRGTRIQTLAETIAKERKKNVNLSAIMTELIARFARRTPTAQSGKIKETLRELLRRREMIAKEALRDLESHPDISLEAMERKLEEHRARIFTDPVAEYLIEYGAPRDLFEFLKLGPANALPEEQKIILHRRSQGLLQAVTVAESRLRDHL